MSYSWAARSCATRTSRFTPPPSCTPTSSGRCSTCAESASDTSVQRLTGGSTARLVAIELAILVALAAAMFVMGREFVCRCGVVALWAGDIMSNQNSQQFGDPYSFTHITHGVLLFWLVRAVWRSGSFDARLILVTMIEASWEAIENTDAVINRYRETTVSLGYYGDSILNSVSDVGFCVLGFMIASRLSGRVAAVGVVAMEAVLLWWIRDSLLLNIIMLIFPIAAIRRWQMGG